MPHDDPPTLDPATVERMAADDAPILIALSGGGDSTALLHLMCAHFGCARLCAVVIDHALREGSHADASHAAGFAAALGVTAEIVRLEWPNGPERAQAAAREARYRALCNEARGMGARVIALGHTRDDQAETVLLRAARGSSWRGLAGMRGFSPAPIWPEGRALSIARPLLSTRRAPLRAYLRARGADWIEDPANRNADFARVRMRARLGALAHAGLEPMRLAALAERLAPRADALDRQAAALIGEAVQFRDDTLALAPAKWRADAPVRARALSALVAAASGSTREPGIEQVEALDVEIAAPGFRGATLGGATLSAKRDEIIFTRDAGALAGRADGAPGIAPMALPAGREAVWDGRVALCTDEPGWSVIAARGGPQLMRGETRADLAAARPQWLIRTRVNHLLGT